MQRELPQNADVVVIGGGIVGASVAWQLASRGAGKVVLIERSIIAAGSSGRTGALLRQHYSNLPEAILASRSLEIFRNWSEIVGGDCGFDQTGLIVTVPTGPGFEANIERLKQNVAQLNGLGVAIEIVDRAQLCELDPAAQFDDISHATFESDSGYVDAIAATSSMATAAKHASAVICQGIEATAIESDGSRVRAIVTSAGRIETPQVVLAAGAWSVPIARTVGIELPIEALRVQVGIFQHGFAGERSNRSYVDNAAGIFCRPWGPNRTMIGLGGGDQHDPVDPDNFERRNDLPYPEAARTAGSRRFPAFARAAYLHGHAGIYDMSPDGHPIIGNAGLEGLMIVAGFSGAGFKKGPAVGIAVADQLLNGGCDWVDLNRFALDRFATPSWQEPWSTHEYDLGSDFGHGL
ncbi:FAD-binding oxidoreductase [soil metagenome]